MGDEDMRNLKLRTDTALPRGIDPACGWDTPVNTSPDCYGFEAIRQAREILDFLTYCLETLLIGFQGGQYLFRVSRNLNLSPDARDLSLPVNQECSPLDSHVLAPIEALFDPAAVRFDDLSVFIRSEDDPQLVL